MAVVEDIGNALLQAGLVSTGAATDWKLFYGYLQDTPDRAVCVYETAGVAPEEGFAIDYPDVQIRVRGKPDDYQAVRAKLQAIFGLLHCGEVEINAVVSPSGGYVYFYAKHSGPIPLGQDEKRRPALAQNYRCMKNRP